MANAFHVEWTEGDARRRTIVQFGNFDGTQEQAQKAIDRLWPQAYRGKRKDWVVGEPVGKVVSDPMDPSKKPNLPAGEIAPVRRSEKEAAEPLKDAKK
jgi:hypothetical protein